MAYGGVTGAGVRAGVWVVVVGGGGLKETAMGRNYKFFMFSFFELFRLLSRLLDLIYLMD